jgi:DNA-binding beta-propeller fold protein YncE
VDAGHGRILQVTTAGLASVVQMTGVTNLSPLFGAALDPAGNVYIPDWGNNRIVKVNVAGLLWALPTPTEARPAPPRPQP